jgi:sulfur-oxidizing protein SoxY
MSGELSRRGFLGWAAASSMGVWARNAWPAPPAARLLAGDPARLSPFERQHLPVLTLPERAGNGAKVPLVVEMSHPMTPEHHVTRVEVSNPTDPIASKGVFHFTPDNGRVYLAWQARLGEGIAEVLVTAECNRHGRWSSRRAVEVSPTAGPCGLVPASAERPGGEDVRAPVLRIPELVERGRLRRGEAIRVQVKMRHPSRAGTASPRGEEPETGPLYLRDLVVDYCGQRVSRFALTPALSDDPFITFGLLARQEGPVAVRLVNNRGQRFEASHQIHLS